jgi:hypothetical protein
MICFDAQEAFGDPLVVERETVVHAGVVHERLILEICNISEPVRVHADFAKPSVLDASVPFLLFNPGGRGRCNTDWVIWAARRYGIATMSYDWPGRHRSLPLQTVPSVIDPFHNEATDVRRSYAYTLTNTAAGVYKYWLNESAGHLRVLAGSSWGSVVGLLLAAKFSDHDLAYVEFGAGNFARDVPKRSYWQLWQQEIDEKIVASWREAFDPIYHVETISKPVIMATASNDKFFSLEMFESTFEKIRTSKAAVVAPNCDHNMRGLNPQLLSLTAAASQAKNCNFSWLAAPRAVEAVSDVATFQKTLAWFSVGREHNHVSRLWRPYCVDSKESFEKARQDFIAEHASLLYSGDEIISFVSFRRAAFGDSFTFTSAIDRETMVARPTPNHAPLSLDLKPARIAEYQDSIAYRLDEQHIAEDAAVLRFVPGGEAHVTISGVLPPPPLATLSSEVRVVLEVLEPLKVVGFGFVRDAEMASEEVWGVEINLGDPEPGDVIHAIVPLSDMRWYDLLENGMRNRKLTQIRSAPLHGFEPARVTGACFWVPPRAQGAIRVLDLLWTWKTDA